MSGARCYSLFGSFIYMSRLAHKPINIPQGVTITGTGNLYTVRGKNGELSRSFRPEISIEVTPAGILVAARKPEDGVQKALVGTYASHLRNMIHGVSVGFTKKMIIEGVGYKVALVGANLEFALGFSHPVVIPIPSGITVSVEKNTITITGSDKELVGQFGAYIRSQKKPEPYKGKGIRYETETIRRKEGKKNV